MKTANPSDPGEPRHIHIDLEKKVEILTRELAQVRGQQAATSEMLRVISSSPGELQPVFEAMLANATTLCEASYGVFWFGEADALRLAAIHGALPEAFMQLQRSKALYRPGPGTPANRALATHQPVGIADLRATEGYLRGDPLPVAAVEIAGVRTIVAVPMFRETEAVGVIAIYRKEVRPFTNKQIELVNDFAAQAVIAIENTRLLTELRESLQQQTATADVLKVISTATGELEPVFRIMLENATRICSAHFGSLWRFEDGAARVVRISTIRPRLRSSCNRGHTGQVRKTRSLESSELRRFFTSSIIAPMKPTSIMTHWP
jgi:GAF domain-containing protein